MTFRSIGARTDSQFPRHNVSGLKGYVFGRHWHETKGPKVPTGYDWGSGVRIAWESEEHFGFPSSPKPVVRAVHMHWPQFDADLDDVERYARFPLLEHCRKLCTQSPPKKPVFLEWGCGLGNAAATLTSHTQIQGRALVFGYADVWDEAWNKVKGVKFLFFVKEQLPEYFRRKRLEVDVIFTHCGLEMYVKGDDLLNHLRDLAQIMATRGAIVFPANYARQELLTLNDIFEIDSHWDESGGHYLMTKR